jgi:hypothetical protein
MADEFAHLYGRSLVSFARDVTGSLRWDTIDVGADGGVKLYCQWRHALRFWGRGTPSGPPDEPSPRALVDVIEAIRTDRVRLKADGDRTSMFAEDVVPSGLLRGHWRVRDTQDGEEWVRSIDPLGREVVEPTYNRPRFAAAKKPVVAERTGTAGRPTSWHLVEAECRRRYAAGDRQPGKYGESPTAWARVLIPWLSEYHPTVPPLGKNAARNKLSRLLRGLEKGA